ncbi:MAG: hypothetical protein KDA37_09630, partial [Planctomycetales bacterium]|nr:hypothetical protein [Planctomycetales bacterium]
TCSHGYCLKGMPAPSPAVLATTPMQTATNDNTTLARPIAAEDLRAGDSVAVLYETYEYVSFLWGCDASLLAHDQPVRVSFRPRRPGLPLRVVDLCLPFVLVKAPGGRALTLDVRGCQLVKLDPRYAKRVRKSLKKPGAKRRKAKR